MKRILMTMLIVCLLSIAIFAIYFIDKPSIEEASIEDIQAVQGIGEVLSLRIVDYIESNPNADIDDLIVIKGIGPEKVKLLRKEFK